MLEKDTGEEMDAEDRPGRARRALAWSHRQIRWRNASWIALILLVVYIGAWRAGETRRTRAIVERDVAGGCLFWGDIARYAPYARPLPPAGSLGRTVLADSYVSYETHQCVRRFGPLPAPPEWLAVDVDRARVRVVKRGMETSAPPLAPTRLFG